MKDVLPLLLASYFAGSIPFGFLIGKLVKGIDLRDFGSGNIGATNAGRVLGYRWGLICLVLDALKGLLPVAFLPALLCDTSTNFGRFHAPVLAGVATIVGHMFPCWLGFKGGKGVATSLGVLVILSPEGVLVAALIFFSSFALFRIVSLSSLLAAIGFGVAEFVRLAPAPFSPSTWSQAVFALLVPLLIIIQHRTNIRRLIKGEEKAMGSAKTDLKNVEGEEKNEEHRS